MNTLKYRSFDMNDYPYLKPINKEYERDTTFVPVRSRWNGNAWTFDGEDKNYFFGEDEI